MDADADAALHPSPLLPSQNSLQEATRISFEYSLKVPSQEFFYRLDRIFTPILVYKTHF